jgi:putative ABC transport system permease protein
MDSFYYQFTLAWLSLRRNPWLSAQLILTIAFGIGSFSTAVSAMRSLTGDPLNGRGAFVYHPQVDANSASEQEVNNTPPDDLTLRDAMALFMEAPNGRRFITSRNWLPLVLDSGNTPSSVMASTRAATTDFFHIMRAPFLFGRPWDDDQDTKRDRVVVLSRRMNQRLFGGRNSLGNVLYIATKPFKVVGVLDSWNVLPHFYDLGDGPYADSEDIYLPFQTWLTLPQDYGYGPMVCQANGAADKDHNPQSDSCTWVQLWVELHGSEVASYEVFLKNYSAVQKSLGRFDRAPNIRLLNALQWIHAKHALPGSVQLEFIISAALLAICLIAAAGIQVARFRTRYAEFGLRRALGASQSLVVQQLLIESAQYGAISGVLGVIFSFAGVEILRHSTEKFAKYIEIYYGDLVLALMVSVIIAVLTTLGPALSVAKQSPFHQIND